VTRRQVTFWTAVAAALVSVGVIVHEWRYRVQHPHAVGVSGELIALAVVGLLISIAVLAVLDARGVPPPAPRSRLVQQQPSFLSGDTFKSIEGNTNDEASAEGFEVCARVHG
jgi:hypothetical protein